MGDGAMLIGRRGFIGSAALLTVMPRAARGAVPLRVICDARFSAGRAFARAARIRGIQACTIEGDVTRLWRDDLRPHWIDRGIPVAGLTTGPSLFCLERLAWDHGYRVVARDAIEERGTTLIRWLIAPRGAAGRPA